MILPNVAFGAACGCWLPDFLCDGSSPVSRTYHFSIFGAPSKDAVSPPEQCGGGGVCQWLVKTRLLFDSLLKNTSPGSIACQK